MPRPLGQHFLHEQNIINKIIAHSSLSPQSSVLEIGPGRGALTTQLVASGGRVVAVELDSKLAEKLPRHPNLTVIRDNFLKLNLAEVLGSSADYSWQVVANLPYYITTPIIEKLLLESHHKIDSMIIMVQKEVAQRMAAMACREASALSYFVQYYAEVDYLFTVKPGCFSPPPKVDSAVVKLTIRRQKPVEASVDLLFKIIRTSFAQRRKTLRRSLASLDDHCQEALAQANIDENRRPETLQLAEFAAIARSLEALHQVEGN